MFWNYAVSSQTELVKSLLATEVCEQPIDLIVWLNILLNPENTLFHIQHNTAFLWLSIPSSCYCYVGTLFSG